MARIKNIAGLKLSGTIDGLVFVQVGDQTYVRTLPQRKKDNWSEKQKQHRERFAAFTMFYRMMSKKFVKPIWNLLSTKNVTGYNLFLKANLQAFDESGQTADPAMLHFSTGTLPLPRHITINKDENNPMILQIGWESTCVTGSEKPDDELLMAEGDHTFVSGPVNTGVKRQSGNATVDLSGFEEKQEYHLHFFFCSANRSQYSPDYYYHARE